MSLADMFSSPIAAPPRSHRADPPTTPTRNAQPLFFSPGSAAGTPARPVAGPSTSRPAVPASVRAPTEEPYNFDIDDDDLPIPDIPPPLTSRPAANANANANQSIRQENGIFRGLTQAGGDFAPLIDPFAGVRAAADAGDEDGGGKKRRVMAKVDADRLMEANGLPALMQKAKRFKVRGKGREVEDLGELMNMYQLWAHKMFPKGDFAHTMQRVEVMCRGRRMNSALKGYREAFYPPRKSPSPIGRSPSPIRSEDEDEPINAPNGASAQRQHASQSRSRSPSHSQFRPMQAQRSSSPPLLSERNDEEMDMDEEAALEELMREEAQGEARTQGGSWSRATANGTSSMLGPEPLFAPGEPDDEELAALLEMQDDM